MPHRRYPPDDPREWLNRAASNLRKAASALKLEGIYPEDVCFDCQQAVEKALKGVLIRRCGSFPKTHSIEFLAALIRKSGLALPPKVVKAAGLTEYAQGLRYPGWTDEATAADAREALRLARAAVQWARKAIRSRSRPEPSKNRGQEAPDLLSP